MDSIFFYYQFSTLPFCPTHQLCPQNPKPRLSYANLKNGGIPKHVTLDELIKKNQKIEGHSGKSTRRGPDRRLPYRHPIRTTPYIHPQVQQMVPIGGSGTVSTKLYVSNLDYSVSNEDIKVLFSEVGMLERYSINYDRSGRSKGTAEVVYTRQADALAAIERYNNVELDGKPLKIELIGVNIINATRISPITGSILGKPPNGDFKRQDCILGRGGDHGIDVNREKGHTQKVSAESLDADLEKYNREAVLQIK